eukprot:augustus_masked-scaffold_49-processed-gene-0.52-mRNA-1 protein AED:0.43 eAED:0.43 QI:0/-1/0/1/-1/1/1/0/693
MLGRFRYKNRAKNKGRGSTAVKSDPPPQERAIDVNGAGPVRSASDVGMVLKEKTDISMQRVNSTGSETILSRGNVSDYLRKRRPQVLGKEHLQKLIPRHEKIILNTPNVSLKCSIWDTGGQSVYFPLHHLFLTRNGLYLVVFNIRDLISEDTEKAMTAEKELKYWLRTISVFIDESVVVLVGTGLDLLSQDEEIRQNQLQKADEIVAKTIVGRNTEVMLKENEDYDLKFFPISNKTQEGVSKLKSLVVNLSLEEPRLRSKITMNWVFCLDEIELYSENQNAKYIPYNEIHEIAKNAKIYAEEVRPMLRIFHSLGLLIFLDQTTALRSTVVTNPQWLIDKVSLLVRDPLQVQSEAFDRNELKKFNLEDDYDQLRKHAVVSEDLLQYIWGDDTDFLTELMSYTMLLVPWEFPLSKDFTKKQNSFMLRATKFYLVPALLKGTGHIDPNEWKKGLDEDPSQVFRNGKSQSVGSLLSKRTPSIRVSLSKFTGRGRVLLSSIGRGESSFSNGKAHPYFIVSFKKNYLPNGVFSKLICLCISFTHQVKVTKNPILKSNWAKIFYQSYNLKTKRTDFQSPSLHSESSYIELEENLEKDRIEVLVEDEMLASTFVTMLFSMLTKIKQDVMDQLKWEFEVFSQVDQKLIPLDEAVARQISPWMTSKNEIRKSGVLNKLSIDDFLSVAENNINDLNLGKPVPYS